MPKMQMQYDCTHDPSGPGYGLGSSVVMAQMEGRELPHVEMQAGDHWEMHADDWQGEPQAG